MKQRALFLDRDGVINIDHGYVHKPEDFDFVNGIFELIAAAKKNGYLIVIVTNQAGIGRGYYTEADFHKLMNWVRQQIVQQGGEIDAIYYCPDHPEHGIGHYRRDSEFRKPGPGMLFQAQRELDLDLAASIFVGDNTSDMLAGQAAGVGTLLHIGRESSEGPGTAIRKLDDALAYLIAKSQ
ncbi:D-glycero-alpha-D-manno-heptose-1,7-bisphosphate 7-phosphatase [Chitiniphilus eburneus]|uniref:D,D-heptose 1,7-bisphosphate phosphatase n=1 Tax=Chitiniphilus eburneus TaxID=2571148 RepID=A0A4U0Q7S0_9NEIS|nr:HAD family hydrolase [Chitiniphilus eburneus]TJZ77287.1 HAD family hydrolase [Chitiniphilus eburneus]